MILRHRGIAICDTITLLCVIFTALMKGDILDYIAPTLLKDAA